MKKFVGYCYRSIFVVFLSVFLTLIGLMLFSSSALAAQDGDYTYSESGGNATITAYTGAGGDISIPATLGGFPTVAIGDYVFSNNNTLTSVTIPGSVTTIGTEAFRLCENVTSVTIPEGVTTIGYRAFARMYALTSVYIPASVTSIGTYGFFGGKSNTGITVHADNPNYSGVDGVLYNKGKTTLIQYPCGKAGALVIPATVTSIGIAACELSANITSITFTGNVETIAAAAFESLTSLTSIAFPSSLTSIGLGAFYGCTKLTSAYFHGNAPTMGAQVFDNSAIGFTVYYLAGALGFTNPWYGYPTELASRSLVREYYLDILDREPDQAGWDWWTNQIVHINQQLGIYVGEGFQALARFYFNSAEYLAKGKTDSEFLVDVYQTFLQREPDQAGFDYWMAQLTAGLTRGMVITQFAYSDEFKAYMTTMFGPDTTRPENNLLNDFYRGFLNVFPDDAGFNYYLSLMRTYQCNNDPVALKNLCHDIALSFIQSAQYTNRNRTNAEYVEDLYNGILRRGADASGFLFWVNVLNNGGMSRAGVLQQFTDGPEFQGRVNAVIAAGCLP